MYETEKENKLKEIELETDKKLMILKKLDDKLGTEATDIIGGLPTKFHYKKVAKQDFELTDDMLLYLDDKTLSKIVPMNSLAPYREEEYKMNKFKITKEMKQIRKEIEKKKQQLLDEMNEQNDNIEANKALLGKKRN